MRLIANRPCTFGGNKFLTGEEIPVELVANPKAQEKMGTLSIANDDGVTQQSADLYFQIPIHTEQEDLIIRVTNEELTVFTNILQTGVNSTEDKQKISDLIQKVESEDLLILLDALDGRKFVKEKAQGRAKVLTGGGE